ncbi:hypothetical protein B0H10DRAFT_2093414 [Mycena sp. CBHHK59/15]|nr:hypothetical protein B0H10DRAFT_2093414 [Mycena sp. CBHHK59/15]
MCALSIVVWPPVSQHTAAETSVMKPAQSDVTTSTYSTAYRNGPQCCHCGWRGGEHDSNCPFK